MAMTCGIKCAKIVLVIFNMIFFIGGLVVMGIGIWLLVDKSSFVILTARLQVNEDLTKFERADTMLQQAAYLLIASGVIVFVVAFLGCCGALKEWRPLLITYAIFLIIILGLEIAAGIYAAVYRSTSSDYVPTTMRFTLSKRYQHDGVITNGTHLLFRPANFWTNTWNKMMIQLECCGIDNGNDFITMNLEQFKPLTGPEAPVTCCKLRSLQSMEMVDYSCANSRSKLWTQTSTADGSTNLKFGCLRRIQKWLDDNLKILIGVGIGIGLLQIFGIVFAFCLCIAIKTGRNEIS
ncbi:CD151 antigen-like [Paramacrobiotus metropolitanus]|uniref:CD151 antigen-like n=1 Tax=Paramacrobiotus metropolitanus TaxID=2943436 RepID=UPI002445B230|nr:CD151 antigen-like [Paramacrobiotus metropolitanus]